MTCQLVSRLGALGFGGGYGAFFFRFAFDGGGAGAGCAIGYDQTFGVGGADSSVIETVGSGAN